MTVSTSSPLNAVTTVAVAPTETVVLSVARESLRGAKRITVGVQNDDGSQTFAGTVYRRLAGMTVWAASTIGDFGSIAAGTSVVADLDVEGTDELEVRGTMSGAGGNVRVKATRKAATP
jgi:hypothetical protein